MSHMWQQWGFLAGVSADDRAITVLILRSSLLSFMNCCLCRWEASASRSIFVSIKAALWRPQWNIPAMCLCAGHRERTEGSTEVLWRAALSVSDTFWSPRWSHLLKRAHWPLMAAVSLLFHPVRPPASALQPCSHSQTLLWCSCVVHVKRACHVFTVQMLLLTLHNIALIPGSVKASDPVLAFSCWCPARRCMHDMRSTPPASLTWHDSPSFRARVVLFLAPQELIWSRLLVLSVSTEHESLA